MLTKEFSERFHQANVARANEAFACLRPWTPDEWVACLLGEIGEVINVAKKMKRLVSGGREQEGFYDKLQVLRWDLGKELADVYTYAGLVSVALGIERALPLPATEGEMAKPFKAMVRDLKGSFSYLNQFMVHACKISVGMTGGFSYQGHDRQLLQGIVTWIAVIAQAYDIENLEESIVSKFNEVSERSGSKIFL